MKIIGWIREGDRAACGAMVVEGDRTCRSHGRAYTFVGARMACPKNCVIAEGFTRSTLTNGRARVIHGMKTSGGCPCLSTLNDIDGVGNSSGDTVAEQYFLDADGQWTGITGHSPHKVPHDEQLQLIAPLIAGVPYYVETTDGRRLSGRIGLDGLLPRVDTHDEDEYAVYWGDDALAKMKEAAA
ncbi:PAAR domain-containing protein [uncultured Herbaspirillum sp.]|uniref:PAAR domain-containing protein n=1 Tax=uncultured Herbaspirillum sp. TaxID=160236 RepID=UPI0025865E2A|nr:PAAR domain-containing protein [uncultured Herbaspirillum sp.]